MKLTQDKGDLLKDLLFYRRMIGKLLYLTVANPDLSFSVHKFNQFLAKPRVLHMWAIQHVLQYLKAWFEILVNTDISILGFYEYVGNIGKISVNIGKISVDILAKILVKQKLFKIHGNVWKTLKKMIQ